ncbi:MAG: SMP-30/gluconolactonase/LRE family protein [Lacunisphaera sp.]|nr:SMP-30/gluconolactonase/LRE family protein [Lacunisphaera sp.]
MPARLGEGICWHPQRQTLWWVDILGQRYFESAPAGGPPRVFESRQMISALAPRTDGGLVAAMHDGIYLVEPDSGNTVPFATPADHDPRQFRFNDAKVDPRGRLWAGTLALDGRAGESRLYCFGTDRAVRVMRERVSISNGLAWSSDAQTLYYIDSPTRTVQEFSFDPEPGTLGPPRVAISLVEKDGLPDGCCLDVEGCLWVAHWGAAKLTRWEPRSGRLLRTVALPVSNVTSCAFGGERRDQLFITTAVDDSRGDGEPEAGFVFRIDPGTSGPLPASFAGR